MDEKTLKTIIKKEFQFCLDIMKDIEKHNGSEEIQRYAQEWAEIESPVVGGTDAPWIRINWDGIYIMMILDKENHLTDVRMFQLDFEGCYGAELIDCFELEDFYHELNNLSYERIMDTLYDGLPYAEELVYVPYEKER